MSLIIRRLGGLSNRKLEQSYRPTKRASCLAAGSFCGRDSAALLMSGQHYGILGWVAHQGAKFGLFNGQAGLAHMRQHPL